MGTPALLICLSQKDSAIAAKLAELRKEVARWLSYIPQTFPHYTSHTIDHSDEIILQLSHLLFGNNCSSEPHISLSSVEIYALCAAAYLHDAGMVASDKEKAEILGSAAWKAWIDNSPKVNEELKRIDNFRASSTTDKLLTNFLADVSLRRLIAEYIRRSHHQRSAHWAEVAEPQLAKFGLGDELLTRTIASLCRGHGLNRKNLEDDYEFPLSRQVFGVSLFTAALRKF